MSRDAWVKIEEVGLLPLPEGFCGWEEMASVDDILAFAREFFPGAKDVLPSRTAFETHTHPGEEEGVAYTVAHDKFRFEWNGALWLARCSWCDGCGRVWVRDLRKALPQSQEVSP